MLVRRSPKPKAQVVREAATGHPRDYAFDEFADAGIAVLGGRASTGFIMRCPLGISDRKNRWRLLAARAVFLHAFRDDPIEGSP